MATASFAATQTAAAAESDFGNRLKKTNWHSGIPRAGTRQCNFSELQLLISLQAVRLGSLGQIFRARRAG